MDTVPAEAGRIYQPRCSLVLLLSQGAARSEAGQAAVYHPSPAHQMMIQIHTEIYKSQWFIAVLYFCINHLIIIPNGV